MLKRIFGLTFLIVFAVVFGVVGGDVFRFFEQPLGNSKPVLIEVPPGTSFDAVTARLAKAHILRHPRDERYMSFYAQFTGQARRIKSGEYMVPPHQRPAQLLALLVSGRTRQYHLTLVEGWRFSQIMQAVNDDDALKHTLKGKSDAEIMAALGHPNQHPEGRFMPDTYMFPRGETDVAFLKRSYRAMQDFLQKAWKNRARDVAVNTPYQALILASIIEKETATPVERDRVSGVYSRRLRRGMRLQADPTVLYTLPVGDRVIYKSDLQRDTPYNTYRHTGLPPTPIDSPSRSSIRAALHPAKGKALYFVARGDGTHVFSDTLAEQNRAVQKYLRGGS